MSDVALSIIAIGVGLWQATIYGNSGAPANERVTEDGEVRVTESLEIRVIE